MAITLRQESATGATTKGDSLTFSELDNNFIDLLQNKLSPLQVDADTGSVTLGEAQSNGVFNITGGTDITTTVTEDSAGNADLVIAFSGSAGIANVVEDTSPQLGGALDVNGQSIVSASDGNITIAPNGTGNISLTPATGNLILDYATWPAEGTNGHVLSTNGSGTLSWVAQPSAGISDVVDDTTPQLGGDLDGQGNKVEDVEFDNYKETIYTGGSTTGTITPDVANGNVQSITLTGSITFNAFSNPETGQSMTLIVKQPSSGGPYTLTSTMKFAGGTKTLSTAADAIDVISVVYDGTNYYASLSTNFS